jgi:hypothetical protein
MSNTLHENSMSGTYDEPPQDVLQLLQSPPPESHQPLLNTHEQFPPPTDQPTSQFRNSMIAARGAASLRLTLHPRMEMSCQWVATS